MTTDAAVESHFPQLALEAHPAPRKECLPYLKMTAIVLTEMHQTPKPALYQAAEGISFPRSW
jgi:hypothetical protein